MKIEIEHISDEAAEMLRDMADEIEQITEITPATAAWFISFIDSIIFFLAKHNLRPEPGLETLKKDLTELLILSIKKNEL